MFVPPPPPRALRDNTLSTSPFERARKGSPRRLRRCPSFSLPPMSLLVISLLFGSCDWSSIRPPSDQPILNKMTDEQEADKVVWTPSKMIERLGREIDNEDSIYYWCAKVCVSVCLSGRLSWLFILQGFVSRSPRSLFPSRQEIARL